MPAPAISVVMPVYNGERHLAAAIESLRTQTCRDFEIIAVNDGSTDRTAHILNDCAATEPRLRVLTNAINLGIPKTCNIGLAAARGEYIARHDADDCSMPARLETQINYLQAHPEVALVGSARYVMSAAGEIKRNSARLLKPLRHTKAGSKSAHPNFDDLLKANHFVHGSVMFRKNVLDELGGYNELFAFAQDYELWLRIARHHKTANLLEPLYALRSHASSVTKQNAAKSLLYHHLAINSAQGRVSDATLARIKQHGIAGYYQDLAPAGKTRYHKALANTFYRSKKWRDALREYQALKKQRGANLKVYARILLLRVRCWRGGEPPSLQL